ncbi:hypothetical protein OVA29_14880 [Exiguobacterium sp. SL14]|nr:hypothetical protein [Exiguobacterium sp. SL14]MCY1691792.1 hypothetical protein [Exiguobacterium sp. SL14]
MLDTRARKIVQPLFDQGATLFKKIGLSATQVTIILVSSVVRLDFSFITI